MYNRRGNPEKGDLSMKTEHSARLPLGLAAILSALYVLSLVWLSLGSYRAGASSWMMALNAVLLSIPLSILYFSTGVLALAARQKRLHGRVSGRLAAILYRTPRMAGVLFTLSLAVFALDVFEEGGGFWHILSGFAIHALPAVLMAALLALAWRREWIGFLAFLAVAVTFFVLFGHPPRQMGILLVFSAPMAAIAMLFLANWVWRDALRLSA
jgi:hypothetical protein